MCNDFGASMLKSNDFLGDTRMVHIWAPKS